jgi:hypothetical protein
MQKRLAMKTLKQAVLSANKTRVRCNEFRQSRVVVDSQLTTNLFIMSTSLDNDAFEAYLREKWERVKHAFPTNSRKNIEKILNTQTK